ncbi:MAG TPA: tRNA 4-thiouridine(8) synthase ThiI [Candidatus Portnoybacteria bacterium]|nr:tRNA 4-thiouridine(8) synthase ThiI [Candidatus Portnoybacteria bacterium]
MQKKVKALVLLSGGLDSILAVKLLLEQGAEVEAVNFRTNFCGPSKALLASKMLGVKLREVNIRQDFLPVLKNPKHGYGTALNPCIDCHALMLKKAGEIMRAEGFDLVATGEVFGQRPMSQHKQALDIVEKDASLKGYLLRPLSAKLLEPTIAEQEGLIDRNKLLAISGRSRKEQMALAKEYGIKEYPSPAGGCALTQKDFAGRLKELMANKPDFSPEDIDLVPIGRHKWGNGAQIILGRNQEENNILENAAKTGDILIFPDGFVGPTALVRGEEAEIARAQELILDFSPKAKDLKAEEIKFKIIKKA